MPSATVAICTHDRAGLIGRAIEAVLGEARAAGAEVLVVDNASTDDTAAVLAALGRRFPGAFRVVHEPRLGLSAARNRALAEARGEVVAYLDDDATPRPGWLAALLEPYATPGVVCTGGRIVLRFESPPPPWLTPALHPALSAFDLGDRPRRVRYRVGDLYPYGANISFRAADALALGGFSTRVGPLGRRPLVHDETDLCFRLDRAGGEIRYAPAAVVEHLVLPERLTPAYLLARHAAGGRSGALFEIRNRGLWRALGKLRWYYRPHLAALPYRPRAPIDPERLARECRRREALGYLRGLVAGAVRLRGIRREAGPPLPVAPLAAVRERGLV
jgi:glycosyltransferase involved in cell wall biosynthesis